MANNTLVQKIIINKKYVDLFLLILWDYLFVYVFANKNDKSIGCGDKKIYKYIFIYVEGWYDENFIKNTICTLVHFAYTSAYILIIKYFLLILNYSIHINY